MRFPERLLKTFQYLREFRDREQESIRSSHSCCRFEFVLVWIVWFSREMWGLRGSWRRSESLSCMKERISFVRPGWKFLILPLGMWYLDPWSSICRKLFSPWEQEDGGGVP